MNDPKSENSTPANLAETEPTSQGEAAPAALSKEEQWALFEKELKESDWGHQPC